MTGRFQLPTARIAGKDQTRAEKSRPYFAYPTNYLIDPKSSVIVDVEATRAIRQAEVAASRTMLDRTEIAFRHSAGMVCRRHRLWLGREPWLASRGAADDALPVIDKSERTDGTWSRSNFEWDDR